MCTKFVWRPAVGLRRPHSAAALILNGAVGGTDAAWPSTGGRSQPNRRVIDRVWNDAKYRSCADGGTNAIHGGGGRWAPPHLVAGDFDSIRPDVRAHYAADPAIDVVHTADQDHTDFTKTARLLLEKVAGRQMPISCVTVIGGLSGRFDHVLSALHTLMTLADGGGAAPPPLVIVDQCSMVWRLPQGEHTIDIDEGYFTGCCGLVPLEGGAQSVTTDGLKWNLANGRMEFTGGGVISTSNQLAARRVHVATDMPLFAIFELTADARAWPPVDHSDSDLISNFRTLHAD